MVWLLLRKPYTVRAALSQEAEEEPLLPVLESDLSFLLSSFSAEEAEGGWAHAIYGLFSWRL